MKSRVTWVDMTKGYGMFILPEPIVFPCSEMLKEVLEAGDFVCGYDASCVDGRIAYTATVFKNNPMGSVWHISCPANSDHFGISDAVQ